MRGPPSGFGLFCHKTYTRTKGLLLLFTQNILRYQMKRQLLFEDVPYNDAIETLRRIMNTSLFVTDQRAKTNKANLT